MPFQRFMPLKWEPGFGSVSSEQTNDKFFLGQNRRFTTIEDDWRTEMSAWTKSNPTPGPLCAGS